jgi:hypothetical protein
LTTRVGPRAASGKPQKQKGDDIFTSVPNSGSCLSFTKDISSKHNKNRVSSCNLTIFFQNKRARFIIGSGHWTLHYSNKPVDPACCTLDRLLNKKKFHNKRQVYSVIVLEPTCNVKAVSLLLSSVVLLSIPVFCCEIFFCSKVYRVCSKQDQQACCCFYSQCSVQCPEPIIKRALLFWEKNRQIARGHSVFVVF